MKTIILTMLLAFIVLAGKAQPKQHTYYDTVVTKKTNFLPDTIPVYYLELIVPENGNQEQPYQLWRVGYVIWQTYKKSTSSNLDTYFFRSDGLTNIIGTTNIAPKFLVDEYKFTQEMPGIFIDNKKQRVPKGNRILKAFAR